MNVMSWVFPSIFGGLFGYAFSNRNPDLMAIAVVGWLLSIVLVIINLYVYYKDNQ